MRTLYFINLFYIQLSFIYTTQLPTLPETFVLKKTTTYVRNASELLEKLNRVIEMGPNRLLIVTDFDQTLTVDSELSGKKVFSSFPMLKLCPSIPQAFKDADSKLYEMYWPIVTNTNFSVERQSKYMTEWYNTRVNLLKGVKFSRNELKYVTYNASQDSFRQGVQELILWSELNKVPVIVLSAGLGDAVEAALETNHLLLPNVKVVSNFLQLDNENVVTGWKNTVIHHHNKNKAIKNSDYTETLEERTNVILMGDETWDANMTDTIDFENRIKIGFLTLPKLNHLQTYLDSFDIVLVNDQTMDIFTAMINLIR